MHAYLSNLDYHLFLAVNSVTKSGSLNNLYIFLAVGLAYVMPAILLVWLFVVKQKYVPVKAVILAVLAALLARWVMKPIITLFAFRNRPYIAHEVHKIISKSNNQASFPSGHALAMFAIASVVYCYNKKMGILMYILAALTALNRVVVGVHYPSDVIAGAILGILAGLLTVKLLDHRIERFLPFTKKL